MLFQETVSKDKKGAIRKDADGHPMIMITSQLLDFGIISFMGAEDYPSDENVEKYVSSTILLLLFAGS